MGVYRRGQGNWARGIGAITCWGFAFYGSWELAAVLPRFGGEEGFLARALTTIHVGFLEVSWNLTGARLVSLLVFLGFGFLGTWPFLAYKRLVDFLIETEEEMRRVSWPWDATAKGTFWGIFPNAARQLVVNSTVVILCVVVMVLLLFFYDTVLQVTVWNGILG